MRWRDFLGSVAAGALVPRQMPAATTRPPRWRENFKAGWLFRRQARGGGALGSFDRNSTIGSAIEPAFRGATEAGYDDSWWDAVNLPHTWNAHDGSDEIPGYFRGIGWYRKHFQLGEELRGKRVFLEFGGANQVSEFWVNGTRIGEHKGGYTSFAFDVSGAVRFANETNVLAVKVGQPGGTGRDQRLLARPWIGARKPRRRRHRQTG